MSEEDPKLFYIYDEGVVQAPAKCAMPRINWERATHKGHCLGQAILSKAEIKKACAHVQDLAKQEACCFDVCH